MRCLYIGDFKKEHSTENYVSHALKLNGVEVRELQENLVYHIDVVKKLINPKPDFVLFAKNRVGISGQALMDFFNNENIKTVTWVFDLYFDLPANRAIRTVFDSNLKANFLFSTDGGHDKEFDKMGYHHKLLRQGIHEKEAIEGNKIPDVPEIVFIGSVIYADRKRLISFLQETYGDRFKHFGQGGASEVRGTDLNDILATAKIVVGDSYPSDNYWSNRVYEITGRGGFLLHPEVKGLETEFEYYKEIVPYKWGNLEQLKEIIDFYLTHDAERETIRKAGFDRTRTEYTYTLRVKELLKQI